MPQLDSTIIFTQLFWLILTFSFLYGCFLFFILPLIVRTLKLRNVLMQLQNTAQTVVVNHKQKLFNSSAENLKNCLKFCELQNLTKIKIFAQESPKNNNKDFLFLQKLHTLFIYNLIK